MSILHPKPAQVNPLCTLSHEVAWAHLRTRTVAAQLEYNRWWDRWTETRSSNDEGHKAQARKDVDQAYTIFRDTCDRAQAEYQAAATGLLVELPQRTLAEV